MREAIVSVRNIDGQAIGLEAELDVFRDVGLDDVEVVTCEGSRGVLRLHAGGPIDEDRLSECSTVPWYERVDRAGPGVAYLMAFDLRDRESAVACDEELLRCRTIQVDDEAFTVGMAGSQRAIRETVAAYRTAGADVRLESLTDFGARGGLLDALTSRQREVLSVAYDVGYFDVPRDASTSDVAAELDLDTSTVSEHIQRAERNLLGEVLERGAGRQ